MPKSRWYYLLRGNAYAFGPTGLMTKAEMQEYLRREWGDGKRIPAGTQYWRA